MGGERIIYKEKTNIRYNSIIFAIIIGIILGLIAKLVDTPEMLVVLPILDDIFGRFSIWIFVATLLAVFSNTPMYAAVRVFSFFISMLLTYYVYTILFLGFFPKSQIILWGSISLISPFCAFVIWYSHQNKRIANILAALPIVALITEWYITGSENILLLMTYVCMIICLLICVPKEGRRRLPIILITAVMTLFFIKTGLMHFIYGELLNI